MKKFLLSIVAVLFVVLGTTTAQASTTVADMEKALQEVNVPAEQALVIANYLDRANLSDEKVNALLGEAKTILNLIGDTVLAELDTDTYLSIAAKLKDAAYSIGLDIFIDPAKIVVEEKGKTLFSLTTDQLEMIRNELTDSKLENLATLAKDLNTVIEVIPPVVTQPVVPPTIESIINEDVVTVITGNGSVNAPLQMEVKADTTVTKVEEMFNQFVGYTIKVTKASTRSVNSYLATLTNSSETLYLSFAVSNENSEMVNYFEELVKTTDENTTTPQEPETETPGNSGSTENNTNNNTNNNTTTAKPTPTTPTQLNNTGFNAMPFVLGLGAIALGAAFVTISRKRNA